MGKLVPEVAADGEVIVMSLPFVKREKSEETPEPVRRRRWYAPQTMMMMRIMKPATARMFARSPGAFSESAIRIRA